MSGEAKRDNVMIITKSYELFRMVATMAVKDQKAVFSSNPFTGMKLKMLQPVKA